MKKIIEVLVDKGHRVSFYFNDHNWYTVEVDNGDYIAHAETFEKLEEMIYDHLVNL